MLLSLFFFPPSFYSGWYFSLTVCFADIRLQPTFTKQLISSFPDIPVTLKELKKVTPWDRTWNNYFYFWVTLQRDGNTFSVLFKGCRRRAVFYWPFWFIFCGSNLVPTHLSKAMFYHCLSLKSAICREFKAKEVQRWSRGQLKSRAEFSILGSSVIQICPL